MLDKRCVGHGRSAALSVEREREGGAGTSEGGIGPGVCQNAWGAWDAVMGMWAVGGGAGGAGS